MVVVSLQASAAHVNNFETFRTSFFNLVGGRDLYGLNPQHIDYFKYSPTFALLFAPFALVPFSVGVLLWNATNAAALWWSLGKVLTPHAALGARALVIMDAIGSMQNVQSNALSAGLMILVLVELERRRELRAAVALGLGTLIKIFPVVAGVLAVFAPYRLSRFVLWCVVVALVLLALPLLAVSPRELAALYQSWGALQQTDALTRGFSVMEHVEMMTSAGLPNWPIQLAGALLLVAPLVRIQMWGLPRFRRLTLASVLMFCVLFNHKAESPTFVVAIAGIAIWFAVSERSAWQWALLVLVIVVTILSSSDAMPKSWQRAFFEPYRIKTLPVLVVWLVVQWQLWTRSPSALSEAPPADASPQPT